MVVGEAVGRHLVADALQRVKPILAHRTVALIHCHLTIWNMIVVVLDLVINAAPFYESVPLRTFGTSFALHLSTWVYLHATFHGAPSER